MARITFAGESLIAQKQGAKEVLLITRFIYAHVPGLDPNTPIDRAAPKPPASQIVHSYDIPAGNSGYVNPNQVVYSSMLGSDIGDFDWNWMGLESAEGVLFAVAYLPLQQKRRNIPPLQIGNNVTRNILVEYSGARELTGITIDASTWQHDFTVRLKGIDERERLSNRDVYGRACFFGDGLQVEKVGTDYKVKPGLAYIEGIRIHSPSPVTVPGSTVPTSIWIDVVLERKLNDVVARCSFSSGVTKADYTDNLGAQHYCIALAEVTAQGIHDRRPVEAITSSLVEHFASRTWVNSGLAKKANTGTTLSSYGITDALPNLNPLPLGSYDLHGADYAFVSAKVEPHLCQNCYWNGINWLRHDINKPAVVLLASAGKVLVKRVEAGANPILWTATYEVRDSSNTYSSADIDQLLAAVNQATSKKADKATSLSGYGITDALPNLNPLPGGSYDLHGTNYAFVSAQLESHLCQNCYWNGTQWMRHDTTRPAVALVAGNGGLRVQHVPPGPNPIVFTSAAQVVDTERRATTQSAGIAPIATLEQLDAGVDDSLIVPPQKLRWGFSISLSANGYIAFPRWLGGLVVQWGNAYISENNTQFLFPIAFPNNCFVLNVGTGENTTGVAEVMNIKPGSLSKTGFIGLATATSTYPYIAIGH